MAGRCSPDLCAREGGRPDNEDVEGGKELRRAATLGGWTTARERLQRPRPPAPDPEGNMR